MPHQCGMDALQTAGNANIDAGQRDDTKKIGVCVLCYGVEPPRPAGAMSIGGRWRDRAETTLYVCTLQNGIIALWPSRDKKIDAW